MECIFLCATTDWQCGEWRRIAEDLFGVQEHYATCQCLKDSNACNKRAVQQVKQ